MLKNYGTHLSKSKGLNAVLDTMAYYDLSVCQIFTKSPHSVNTKPLWSNSVDKTLIDKLIKNNNYSIYIHSQYILNCCRSDLSYTVKSLIEDFDFLENIKGVVLHTGKDTKNLGKEVSFQNMKNNVLQVLSRISGSKKKLILETSVKSKNDINEFAKTPGLARLYNALEKHPNLAFCIDTCHIFASGYDISTVKGIKQYFSEFDQLIGLDKVVLIHLNDSKNKVNCGVDRHAPIGDGYIFGKSTSEGDAVLKYIFNLANKHGIHLVTETDAEISKEKEYIKNILLG